MATETAGREGIGLEAPKGSVAVELGVDTGQLTRRFADLGHFRLVIGVDKWNDWAHPYEQYMATTESSLFRSDIKHIRASAQDFLELVPESSLGMVYSDCYAHTGQDDGAFLDIAWTKIMPGGILAGDDYDGKDWPKTKAAVDKFVDSNGLELNVRTEFISGATGRFNQYPTWWVRKPDA